MSHSSSFSFFTTVSFALSAVGSAFTGAEASRPYMATWRKARGVYRHSKRA